ncbi:MAG: SBBP repeat-containing protein [Bacteroidetes bacterium]|nr:SBBP repeat-containing protein [Bacteroidota bacterium]
MNNPVLPKHTALKAIFRRIQQLAIFTCLLSAPSILTAQTYDWAKSMGGSGSDYGTSVTVDASGNVYTTGYFKDTVDFDPGAGTANLISTGDYDIFVSKLDADGNFVWAKNMGGSSYALSASIALDAGGNVYLTGYFKDTVDFDPGVGTYNVISAGDYDIFIAKIDAAGNFVWAKSIIGAESDRGMSIALDASSNVYTTGKFEGTADFDPGAGTFNLISAGNDDIFISKLDADGNFVWAKNIGGTNDEQGYGIAVEAGGNIYITGNFKDTVDFDPGTGTHNLNAVGYNDIFISKFDTDGNFVWANNMGGTLWDYGCSIAVDAAGNIYTTGYFRDTVDFDPGAGISNLISAGDYDVFISKSDTSGNFAWAKSMGGTGSDYGRSIIFDAGGNVYTTGYFANTVDFDPGAGTHNVSSAGASDVFISKLDADGNFAWAKNMGGTSIDGCLAIAVDASGNVYSTGYFGGTADFDPPTATNLVSNGGYDIFVAKYQQCFTASSIYPSVCDTFTSPSGNYNWTVSGTYTDIIPNSAGCDSIITVHLTINNATSIDEQTACDSFLWIDGNTYYASNNTATYNYVGGAANGCDSVVTLNLTINNNVGIDIITACGSYTWIDGYTYTTSNNTATFTLTNTAGCDSVVTLNLTIGANNTGVDLIYACDTYTWIDSVTYTATNYTATHTLTNVYGCDSVVTLYLTINHSDSETDVVTACGSYTWIDGYTYTSDNNTATDTLTNVAGCDSVVTLNLTINYNTAGNDVVTACNSYTSPSGNYTWTNSGVYTDNIPNASGCDSVITITLTINSADTSVSQSGSTLFSNVIGATYQWLNCDYGYAQVTGQTNQSFTPLIAGNYALRIVDNGCVDTSFCHNISIVGVLENTFGNSFAVFPNPTNGIVTIEMGKQFAETEVVITNAIGQEISRKQYNNTAVINLEIVGENGLYLLMVRSGEKIATVSVLKQQ